MLRTTRAVGAVAAVATFVAAMTASSSADAYKKHRSPNEREASRLMSSAATTATGATVQDGDIASELAAQVQAGHLPAVTNDAQGKANTLYVIFFPSKVVINDGGGNSCDAFCGYHGSGSIGGSTYIYAVIPD